MHAQAGPAAHHEGIVLSLLAQHVKGLAVGDAQAPALAFGIAPQAFMPGQRAQHGAAVAVRLFQQDGAAAGQGQAFRLPAPLQEGPVGVLSGGDEAYLLAFLRYGHCQPRVLHLGDAGGLVLPGKGEHGPAQALQRHEGKEIALVLG